LDNFKNPSFQKLVVAAALVAPFSDSNEEESKLDAIEEASVAVASSEEASEITLQNNGGELELDLASCWNSDGGGR